MTSDLEYDEPVRRSIPAVVAGFGLFLLFWFCPAQSRAQAGIAPGTAGAAHPPTGAVGPPTGAVRPPTGTVPNVNSLVPTRVVPHSGDHHPRNHKAEFGPVWYAVPVPYAVDGGAANSDDSDVEDNGNYQGGATVFDRRGDGADSYVPPTDDVSPAHSYAASDRDDTPDEPPQPTLLVFKDGHKLEVVNYAILGPTLFDMTPGHARRVALADLDLDATRQQNEDRGVMFQIPLTSQAN